MGLAHALGLKTKLIGKVRTGKQCTQVAFNPPPQPGYCVQGGMFLLHYKKDKLVRPSEVVPKKRLRLKVNYSTINSSYSPPATKGFLDALSTYYVKHDVRQGTVPVITMVPPDATDETPVLLMSHGNSTDIGYSFPQLYNLTMKLNVVVVAYDYPGYGAYPGSPTESNIKQTIRTVYQWLNESLGCSASRIMLYGQSMGSYPTCDIAADYESFPVSGVILHSPLASALRVLVPSAPESSSRLERKLDCFRNFRRAKQIPWPILIMHGANDAFVKPENSMMLHDMACHLESQALEYSVRVHAHALKERMEDDWLGPVSQSLRPDDFLRRHGDSERDLAAKMPTHQSSQHFESLVSTACSEFGVDPVDLRDSIETRVELWMVEGAGHSDVEMRAGAEYFRRVSDFIMRRSAPQCSIGSRRNSS